AAGDAGDEPARLLEHAFEHLLRSAHFPQHVDVDRTAAAGDDVGAPHLLHRAVDCIADELLVALKPGELLVNLRDDLAFGVIAVGVHRADRADAAGRGPGTRAHVIGRRNTLAA